MVAVAAAAEFSIIERSAIRIARIVVVTDVPYPTVAGHRVGRLVPFPPLVATAHARRSRLTAVQFCPFPLRK